MGKAQKPWQLKYWKDLTPEEKEQAPWYVKPRRFMSEEELKRYHKEGFRKRKKPTWIKDNGNRKHRWVWNEMTEEWMCEITHGSVDAVLPQFNDYSGNPYIVRV